MPADSKPGSSSPSAGASSGSGSSGSSGAATGNIDPAIVAQLLEALKHCWPHKHHRHHGHHGMPWPGPWWPGPWWPPGPISAAMWESWLQWAASRAAFRGRWWQSMADAAYQARKGYDWCEPDWCYPDPCYQDWPDPCLDTDAIDIKKLKEALNNAQGPLDGDKDKVIEQVVHAVRLARSFEAMRRKRWSHRGRHGDSD
jgi:hypothetical protein